MKALSDPWGYSCCRVAPAITRIMRAMASPDSTELTPQLHWRRAGLAIVVIYFVCSAWGGLQAGFKSDDMMNLHYYWTAGAWKALQGNLLFFSTFYRPMGAAFYLPL